MENHGLLKVDLKIDSHGNTVILHNYIMNIGNAEIALHRSYVFVDQGIYNDKTNSYDFPFLQKKFLGIEGIADQDCVGSAFCKQGKCEYPCDIPHIKAFYAGCNPFCGCYALKHLSSESILYMGPNESFSEDIVLKLSEGIYRAILMVVPKEESGDCICCNKCFCVD